MSNACRSCRHWKQLADSYSSRAGAIGDVGECRAFPPLVNFSFPRTEAGHFCGCWENPDKPLDLASHRKRVSRAKLEGLIADARPPA